MTELNLMNSLRLFISKKFPKTTLWRNNTAKGWAGEILSRGPAKITLLNPFPLSAGLTIGSSDLIGITEITVTPSMVGKKVGVFTALEVKTPTGRPTDKQIHFINFVKSKGGIAGVVRSEEDIGKVVPQ